MKVNRKSWAAIASLLVLFMAGCSSGLDLETTAEAEIVGPEPEIVALSVDEMHSLSDYKVKCSIRNNGEAGNVAVEASVRKDGWWMQERYVRFSRGETRNLEFVFPEPSFWSSSSIGYECNPSVSPEEYKVRVDCLVANKSEDSGTVRVEATVDGSTTESRIELAAEQAKEVSFTFRGAQQMSEDAEYGCLAEEVSSS